ncbi:MAG: hypothetical protein QW331_00465 [Candidatus Woesearchaeota archaeon]
MEGREISITFETLFEFLRREKMRDELQEIDKNFFSLVSEYIQEKMQIINDLKDKTDIFSLEERKNTEKQLEGIRKIAKELYERREKKIIEMAINKSRTGSSLIDVSLLLENEKKLFDEFVELLSNSREDVLCKLLDGRIKKTTIREKVQLISSQKSNFTKLIFKTAVPKFVDAELNVYGPFEENDLAEIPTELANVLVAKGKAIVETKE